MTSSRARREQNMAWRTYGLALGAWTLAAAAPLAECPAPVPPPVSERPAKPALPERPSCAIAAACKRGEADAYNRAVAVYNLKAVDFQAASQAYVARLNAYVAAAEAYAKCEVAALNAG
jgi:hypothetical protein